MMIIISLFMLLVPGLISLYIKWAKREITRSDYKIIFFDYCIYSFLIIICVYASIFLLDNNRTVSFSPTVFMDSHIYYAGFVVKYSITAIIFALIIPRAGIYCQKGWVKCSEIVKSWNKTHSVSVSSNVKPVNNEEVPDGKVSINILLFIFVSILLIGLLDDFCRLGSYIILGDVYHPRLCTLIAVCLFPILLFFVRKHIHISRIIFHPFDFFFLAIFAVFIINKLPFPDVSFDTEVYEIFVGKFALSAKLENMKPYLPVYSAWYSLSSRIYFYVMQLIGYRAAILFNYFIIVVSYYQLKKLFSVFFNRLHFITCIKMDNFWLGLFFSSAAFISLYHEYLVVGAAIIKGDLFVIPLVLECILSLTAIPVEKLRSTRVLYVYFGILVGLGFTLKLSNAVYFLPLIIWFLIKYIHNRIGGLGNIIVAVCFCLIPLLPYLVYSMLLTKSPAFPLYNAVFHSPYYPALNTKDLRWGPQNAIQAIVWPVLCFFEGRFSELDFRSGALLLGFLTAVSVSFLGVKIDTFKPVVPITLSYTAASFLWSLSTGYARYGIFLEVWGLVIFIIVLCIVFSSLKHYKYIIVGLVVLGLMPASLTTYYLISAHWEWSWRPSVFQWRGDWKILIKENMPFVFHDQNAIDDRVLQEKMKEVKTWISVPGSNSTALAVFANPEADFFIIYNNNPQDPEEFTNSYFQLHDTSGLYALLRINYPTALEEFSRNINRFGFIVVEQEEISLKIVDATQRVLFLKLMLKQEAESAGIPVLSFSDIN